MVILVDAPLTQGPPAIGANLPDGSVALSARERDCLRGVAAGGSSKKIASELGLSPYTVDQYVDSAMRKLNAGSRAEAVAKAYVLGLVAWKSARHARGRG
jgi:DNA-binding CsgD family transcriptional regulator